MTKTLLQKSAELFFPWKFRRFENKIGYKLSFRNIPERFIDGLVEWDMTDTFKKAGLDIEEGANYWTMGHIVDGVSSRFDRTTPEYQSWLGGYIVKLPNRQTWTVEDHFKLAIADQNSWLHSYGDPNPLTSIKGQKLTEVDSISAGQYSGTLYEFGCVTHSDVGNSPRPLRFRLECDVIADLFNLSNSKLNIQGSMMRPKSPVFPYEVLNLYGYIAIFDVEKNVKVVLYGNGIKDEQKNIDTFTILKDDLLKAMRSCEIIKK
jgi:hypothetical protein